MAVSIFPSLHQHRPGVERALRTDSAEIGRLMGCTPSSNLSRSNLRIPQLALIDRAAKPAGSACLTGATVDA